MFAHSEHMDISLLLQIVIKLIYCMMSVSYFIFIILKYNKDFPVVYWNYYSGIFMIFKS